jgi:hypothetical protein
VLAIGFLTLAKRNLAFAISFFVLAKLFFAIAKS